VGKVKRNFFRPAQENNIIGAVKPRVCKQIFKQDVKGMTGHPPKVNVTGATPRSWGEPRAAQQPIETSM